MAAAVSPGELTPGSLYTLDEFSRRTGLKRFALRTARKNGLRVLYVAGRAFVAADDAIAYFRGEGEKN